MSRLALALLLPLLGVATLQAQEADLIQVGDRELPRMAPAPQHPGSFASSALEEGFAFVCEMPMGGLLSQGEESVGRLPAPMRKQVKRAIQKLAPDFLNYRSQAFAQEVAQRPPLNRRLGKLVVVRAGLGNVGYSPAFVLRAAQHAERLIVTFSTLGEGPERTLQRLTALPGGRDRSGRLVEIPIPPEIKTPIYGIGSPENNLISFEQASDAFLEQLGVIEESEPFRGKMLNSRCTVVAYSQGCLDAALTRYRLKRAGFPDTIGKLIALAPPFAGSDVTKGFLRLVLGGVANQVELPDGERAVEGLNPENKRGHAFLKEDPDLVDVTFAGTLNPSDPEKAKNIRPYFRFLAQIASRGPVRMVGGGGLMQIRFVNTWRDPNTDGVVTHDSARFAPAKLWRVVPYDHSGMIEDPAVIDLLLEDPQTGVSRKGIADIEISPPR